MATLSFKFVGHFVVQFFLLSGNIFKYLICKITKHLLLFPCNTLYWHSNQLFKNKNSQESVDPT